MILSMTGYGQGEADAHGRKVSAEVRTVNHRFLDLSIRLPRVVQDREKDLRELVKSRIRRGRVTVTVTLEAEELQLDVRVNRELLERYLEELRRFAADHGLDDSIDLRTLAGLPEVFTLVEAEADPEAVWAAAERATTEALDRCVAMRKAEGETLERELAKYLDALEAVHRELVRLAPATIEANQRAFRERLERALGDTRIDPDRWMTEVAILADRLDFSEELARLESHIGQFRRVLGEGGEVSKTLTYLLQEIHREVNTIGSKAADAEVSRYVVEAKELTEKLREQAQNLE
jgi:uncharacterized protein (TIGR00255 family)